jgi:hypothetical protein
MSAVKRVATVVASWSLKAQAASFSAAAAHGAEALKRAEKDEAAAVRIRVPISPKEVSNTRNVFAASAGNVGRRESFVRRAPFLAPHPLGAISRRTLRLCSMLPLHSLSSRTRSCCTC